MSRTASMQPGSARPAVLVVEDDGRAARAICDVLTDAGCPVQVAACGNDALRLLLERDFGAVLLDIGLPDIDGFETARLIRQRPRSRDVPLVFITAATRDESEVLRAYSLGAIDFLYKPIDPRILTAKIGVILNLVQGARASSSPEALPQSTRDLFEEEERALAESSRRAAALSRVVAAQSMVEHELTGANQSLEHENARQRNFLAVLAHELRTPLSPIALGVDLLARRTADLDASTAQVLQSVQRNLANLSGLVSDLVDMASSETDREPGRRRVELSLSETLERAAAIVHESTDRWLSIQLPESATLASSTVTVDPERLPRAIARLIRFAGSNSSGVAIEVDAADDLLVLRMLPTDEPASPPAAGNDRADSLLGGTAWSFAVSIIEQHGGTVAATTMGKAIEVRLPLGVEHASAGTAIRTERDGAITVVLVEDNTDIRELTAMLLRELGFEVHEAASGPEGLELIVRHRPQAAILDLGLPGFDGIELARRVREVLPDRRTRLIALTGLSDGETRQQTARAGFDVHLVKPVAGDALLAALGSPSMAKPKH